MHNRVARRRGLFECIFSKDPANDRVEHYENNRVGGGSVDHRPGGGCMSNDGLFDGKKLVNDRLARRRGLFE